MCVYISCNVMYGSHTSMQINWFVFFKEIHHSAHFIFLIYRCFKVQWFILKAAALEKTEIVFVKCQSLQLRDNLWCSI